MIYVNNDECEPIIDSVTGHIVGIRRKEKPTIDCCGYTRYQINAKSLLEQYLERKSLRTSPLPFYCPVKIIYNGPATIVFWADGTKTVVKRAKKEKDNKYNAFCAALAKKLFGNNSRVNAIVKSGIEEK